MTQEYDIDIRTPLRGKGRSKLLPLAIVCRQNSGTEYLVATSAYKAIDLKGKLRIDSASLFRDIYHPQNKDGLDDFLPAEELVALIWLKDDVSIAPQGLDDFPSVAPVRGNYKRVYFERKNETVYGAVRAHSFTAALPDVFDRDARREFTGLVAASVEQGMLDAGKDAGSLVFAESAQGRTHILGVLVAATAKEMVIAPLGPLFERYGLQRVSDQELEQNNQFVRDYAAAFEAFTPRVQPARASAVPRVSLSEFDPHSTHADQIRKHDGFAEVMDDLFPVL